MTPQEREQFIQDVAIAIRSHAPVLSDDELRWVRLAIQREAQSVDLRKAIIEKTLAGLAWALVVGAFYILKEWASAHGYKP